MVKFERFGTEKRKKDTFSGVLQGMLWMDFNQINVVYTSRSHKSDIRAKISNCLYVFILELPVIRRISASFCFLTDENLLRFGFSAMVLLF